MSKCVSSGADTVRAPKRKGAHVVRGGVAEHVIERVRDGDVFRRFADDDGELDFVVWEVMLHGLDNFRDVDWRAGADDGLCGLVEEDGVSVGSSACAQPVSKCARTWVSPACTQSSVGT